MENNTVGQWRHYILSEIFGNIYDVQIKSFHNILSTIDFDRSSNEI